MVASTVYSELPIASRWSADRSHSTTTNEDDDPLKRTAATEEFLASRPWARSLWRPAPGDAQTFFWLVLIHVTAAVGLVLTPIPGWKVFGIAVALTWLGGIGTTVCYHRSLAHRAVKLHPVVRNI